MKLKKILAKNFLTYEDFEYDFVDKPLMIQGLNLTDENQKSNGSGKSSIQTMIEFCLTGDNSRGVRDIELVRFGFKESFLDLFVQCDSRKEEVHISWKIKIKGSNQLEITKRKLNGGWEEVVFSNVNDGKKWILNWIGISKEDLFNYFIINKTRFKSFFKSSNKEKVELINRFSDASVIDGIEDIDSIELESKYNALKEDILKIDGKIQLSEESLLKQLSRDMGEEFNEKVESIKEDILENEVSIKEIEADLKEVDLDIDKVKGVLEELGTNLISKEGERTMWNKKISYFKETITPLNKDLKKYQLLVDGFVKTDFSKDRQELIDKIGFIESDIEESDSEFDKLESQEKKILKVLKDIEIKLSGNITCPSCSHEFLTGGGSTLEELNNKSKKVNLLKANVEKLKKKNIIEAKLLTLSLDVPKKSIQDIEKEEEKETLLKSNLLNSVNEINAIINEKNKELSKLNDSLNECKEDIESIKEGISTQNNLIIGLNAEIRDLNSSKQNHLQNIDSLNGIINSLKQSDNQKEIYEIRSQIDDLKKGRLDYEKSLKVVENDLYKLNQWKNNFKQFKMFVANKSLETMEFHTNRFLDGLGCDLRVEFEGYKVLANGTIKDEITSNIIRDGERTFNSFSGGERARLLFASILANRHMINETHAHGGLQFLSIDEALEGADSLGLQGLVKESVKLQECIMIISHITDEDIDCDSITVVKESGISKIR